MFLNPNQILIQPDLNESIKAPPSASFQRMENPDKVPSLWKEADSENYERENLMKMLQQVRANTSLKNDTLNFTDQIEPIEMRDLSSIEKVQTADHLKSGLSSTVHAKPPSFKYGRQVIDLSNQEKFRQLHHVEPVPDKLSEDSLSQIQINAALFSLQDQKSELLRKY